MKHKRKTVKTTRRSKFPTINSPGSFSPVDLPKPKLKQNASLLKALKRRQTTREISDKGLSLQTLSNLLWAANGVNRAMGPFALPGRTAASASNSQEIDMYVVLEKGTYLYDAVRHCLIPILEEDLRLLAINPGQIPMIAKAPVQLIYVVNRDRLTHTSGFQEPGLQDPEIQKSYYFVDTGLIAGNVYLFASAHGLAAWFHNCNKTALMEKLHLPVEQKVLFGQTIGYPAK